jgi:hypothetical protein
MAEAKANGNKRQEQEEVSSSTIPQPEGKEPIGAERPSQAEGDRDTVEADLRDSESDGQS